MNIPVNFSMDAVLSTCRCLENGIERCFPDMAVAVGIDLLYCRERVEGKSYQSGKK